jgi:hypothetical protein
MSEPTDNAADPTAPRPDSSSDASGAGSDDTAGSPTISDDQLPDDLNPEKNPLARAPGDEDGAPAGAGGAPDPVAQAPGDPAAGDGPDLG